jgi:hypothetical protein
MWLRIFGRSPAIPSPATFVVHLHREDFKVTPAFKGDDLGWTEASLTFGTGSPILLSRYLTVEDDLRDDLNAYAAELEGYTFQPAATGLMERVIQTQQLITLRKPVDHADEVTLDALCEQICQWLAGETDGIYQADGRGWFAADGTKLVQEY